MKTLSRLFACATLAAVMVGPAVAQNQQIPVIGRSDLRDDLCRSRTQRDGECSGDPEGISRTPHAASPVRCLSTSCRKTGRAYNVVVSEVWQNRGAVATHASAPREDGPCWKGQAYWQGPTDNADTPGHSVTRSERRPARATLSSSAICDVAGGNTQNCINAFAPLSEASRKDAGMVRYELLRRGAGAANHFRLYEERASMAAFEAHDRAAQYANLPSDDFAVARTPTISVLYRLVN
jgi:quinol monooxygenase YgiN